MKLRELLWVLSPGVVIWVATSTNNNDGLYLGSAGLATTGSGVPKEFHDCMVMRVYPEYYDPWAKTGISIIIDKDTRLED